MKNPQYWRFFYTCYKALIEPYFCSAPRCYHELVDLNL
jgi:hypothetical protein